MALKDKIPIDLSLPHRSVDRIDGFGPSGRRACRSARFQRPVGRRKHAGSRLQLRPERHTDLRCSAHHADPRRRLGDRAAGAQSKPRGSSGCDPRLRQQRSGDSRSRALGRPQHYAEFQVSMEHRVRRFREGIEIVRALWTRPRVNYEGRISQLKEARMVLKPAQRPHPPIWLGGDHPDAVRRAVALGDG